jgi:hypothetical protein
VHGLSRFLFVGSGRFPEISPPDAESRTAKGADCLHILVHKFLTRANCSDFVTAISLDIFITPVKDVLLASPGPGFFSHEDDNMLPRKSLAALYLASASLLFIFTSQHAIGQVSGAPPSPPAKVMAPHKPVAPLVSRPQPSSKPPIPRALVGGLWMIDANMKSYLHITNSLVTSSLSVTPVLWLSNGTKFSLPALKLDPSGTAVISINDALSAQGLAPYATLSGYVELDYQWPWPALCATVRNVDSVHSVIFTYSLPVDLPADLPSQTVPQKDLATQAQAPVTQVLEGMWWKQEANVTGFVAFLNSTSGAISASLSVLDNKGQFLGHTDVVVSAHGTKIVDLVGLPKAGLTSGGLRVEYAGPKQDLLVLGGLRDDETGYSAEFGFASPAVPASNYSTTSYSELGLMTGSADPMMFFPGGTVFTPYSVARNISNQPVSVTPNLWWMEGTPKTARLPQFTLAPGETVNLDLVTILTSANLKDYNGSVNLILDVSAKAPTGAVLLASGSVDKTNNYVFPVIPKAVKESIAKDLSYWSTANGDDTMVTLWNPADESQDYIFKLSFAGGHYSFPIHLGPRATEVFNVSEILHSSVPDEDGNVLPPGVLEGSAELSGLQGDAEHILVAFDAATYNVRKATCATHCQTCQGAVNAWVTDNPFAAQVGGTHQLSFTIQNHNGNQYNDTSVAAWSSSNTPIASVSSGLVSGIAPGALNALANDDGWPVYAQQCLPTGVSIDCPVQSGVGGSTPGGVLPTVTISCDTPHLTLGPTNFPGSESGTCHTTVSPSGGAFCWAVNKSTVSLSASGGSANYTSQQASSGQGDTVITVEYTVNGKSNSAQSQGITVHQPTSLKTNSTTPNDHTTTCGLPCLTNPGHGTCTVTPGTSCSYTESITRREYSVQDQFNPPNLFENVNLQPTITEGVNSQQGSCGGNDVGIAIGGGSPFPDDFGKCDSCCESGGPGCTSTATQTIFANGFAVRNESITVTCTSVTLTP